MPQADAKGKRRKTNRTHKNRTEVEKIKWGCVQNQTENHLKKKEVCICAGVSEERERERDGGRLKWKGERERIPSTQGWDDGGVVWDSGGRGHISEGQSKAGTGDCHVWWLLLLYTCSSTLINFGYANQPYCIMASLSSPTDKRMFSCWI